MYLQIRIASLERPHRFLEERDVREVERGVEAQRRDLRVRRERGTGARVVRRALVGHGPNLDPGPHAAVHVRGQ